MFQFKFNGFDHTSFMLSCACFAIEFTQSSCFSCKSGIWAKIWCLICASIFEVIFHKFMAKLNEKRKKKRAILVFMLYTSWVTCTHIIWKSKEPLVSGSFGRNSKRTGGSQKGTSLWNFRFLKHIWAKTFGHCQSFPFVYRRFHKALCLISLC